MNEALEAIVSFCLTPNNQNLELAINMVNTRVTTDKELLLELLNMFNSQSYDLFDNLRWISQTCRINNILLGIIYVGFLKDNPDISQTFEMSVLQQQLKNNLNYIKKDETKVITDYLKNAEVSYAGTPISNNNSLVNEYFSKIYNNESQEMTLIELERFPKLVNGNSLESKEKYYWVNAFITLSEILLEYQQYSKCSIYLHEAIKVLHSLEFFITEEKDVKDIKKEYLLQIKSDFDIENLNNAILIHDIVRLLIIEGKLASHEGDLKSAEQYFDTAITFCEEFLIDLYNHITDVLRTYGSALWELYTVKRTQENQQEIQKIPEILKKALNTFQELLTINKNSFKIRTMLSRVFEALGSLTPTSENVGLITQYLTMALEENLTLLEAGEAANDDLRCKIAQICLRIGILKVKQNQLLDALDHFSQGTDYLVNDTNNLDDSKRRGLLLKLYLEQGRISFMIQDYPQAQSLFVQIQNLCNDALAKDTNTPLLTQMLFCTHSWLAKTAIALKNFTEVEPHLTSMIESNDKIKELNVLQNVDFALDLGTSYLFLIEYYIFINDADKALEYSTFLFEIVNALTTRTGEAAINFIEIMSGYIYAIALLTEKKAYSEAKKRYFDGMKKINYLWTNCNLIYEREIFLTKALEQALTAWAAIISEKQELRKEKEIFTEKALTMDEELSRQINFLYTYLNPTDYFWMATYSLTEYFLTIKDTQSYLYYSNRISLLEQNWQPYLEFHENVSPLIRKIINNLHKKVALELWSQEQYFDAIEKINYVRGELTTVCEQFSIDLLPIEKEIADLGQLSAEWLQKLGEDNEAITIVQKTLQRTLHKAQLSLDSNYKVTLLEIQCKNIITLTRQHILNKQPHNAMVCLKQAKGLIDQYPELQSPALLLKIRTWLALLSSTEKGESYVQIEKAVTNQQLLNEDFQDIIMISNEILWVNSSKNSQQIIVTFLKAELLELQNRSKETIDTAVSFRIIELCTRIMELEWNDPALKEIIPVVTELEIYFTKLSIILSENSLLIQKMVNYLRGTTALLLFLRNVNPDDILTYLNTINTEIEGVLALQMEMRLLTIKGLLFNEKKQFTDAKNVFIEALELAHGLKFVYREQKIVKKIDFQELCFLIIHTLYEEQETEQELSSNGLPKFIALCDYYAGIAYYWLLEREKIESLSSSQLAGFIDKIVQREVAQEYYDPPIAPDSEMERIKGRQQKYLVKNLFRATYKPIKMKSNKVLTFKETQIIGIITIRTYNQYIGYSVIEEKYESCITDSTLKGLLSKLINSSCMNITYVIYNLTDDEIQELKAFTDAQEKRICIVNSTEQLHLLPNLTYDTPIIVQKELTLFRLPSEKISYTMTYLIAMIEIGNSLNESIISIGTVKTNFKTLASKLTAAEPINGIALVAKEDIHFSSESSFSLYDIIQLFLYLGFRSIIVYTGNKITSKSFNEEMSFAQLLSYFDSYQVYGFLAKNDTFSE